MEKGFFVVMRRGMDAGTKLANWKSDLIDPICGWTTITGNTIGEAIEGQQMQYDRRVLTNRTVPRLVQVKDLPMANGKTIRFVPVTEIEQARERGPNSNEFLQHASLTR